MANVLTVYYSRKGENYFGGAIHSVAKGNTEILAEAIADAVGGDAAALLGQSRVTAAVFGGRAYTELAAKNHIKKGCWPLANHRRTGKHLLI